MGAMRTVHRLVLSTQATKGRVIGLAVLGAVGVLIGVGVGVGVEPIDRPEAGTNSVNAFALSLFVPVATLVFAAVALGEPAEEGTLVHLWLRPIRRWQLAMGALTATLTAALPVVLVPVAAMAAATRGGADLVFGSVLAAGIGVLTYGSLFVLLGLIVKRALVWGLAYVLIWEGFVAQAGESAARLSIRGYTRSLLSQATGIDLRLGDFSTAASIIVPLCVTAVAFVLTAVRLRTQEVA